MTDIDPPFPPKDGMPETRHLGFSTDARLASDGTPMGEQPVPVGGPGPSNQEELERRYGASPEPPVQILVVCTANICRSPIAEVLIAAKGVGQVQAFSAGFLENGRAADSNIAALAAERGLDLSRHRSQVIDRPLIERAHVIVTMERRHAREIIVDNRDQQHKVHTLRGLVGAGLNGAARPAGMPVEDWSRALVDNRPVSALMGDGTPDDVSDPYGGPKRGYRRAVEEIEDPTTTLLSLILT